MPNGIDTSMESMEAPSLRRSLYGSMAISEPPQLPNRNHTVLAVSQCCELLPSP